MVLHPMLLFFLSYFSLYDNLVSHHLSVKREREKNRAYNVSQLVHTGFCLQKKEKRFFCFFVWSFCSFKLEFQFVCVVCTGVFLVCISLRKWTRVCYTGACI